jgi:hypothetical protein
MIYVIILRLEMKYLMTDAIVKWSGVATLKNLRNLLFIKFKYLANGSKTVLNDL